MVDQQNKRLYEFGNFCLDPVQRVLLCRGKPVEIQPKALDLLLVMVDKQEQVLEKDELIKLVWPDTIVADANLTTTMSVLRKALGESAKKPRHIVSIPQRGYRFVAEVSDLKQEPHSQGISEIQDVLASVAERVQTIGMNSDSIKKDHSQNEADFVPADISPQNAESQANLLDSNKPFAGLQTIPCSTPSATEVLTAPISKPETPWAKPRLKYLIGKIKRHWLILLILTGAVVIVIAGLYVFSHQETIKLNPSHFTLRESGTEFLLETRYKTIPGLPSSEKEGVDLSNYELEFILRGGDGHLAQPFFKNHEWKGVYADPDTITSDRSFRFNPMVDTRKINEFSNFSNIFSLGVKIVDRDGKAVKGVTIVSAKLIRTRT